MKSRSFTPARMAAIAMLAALSYVVFTFLQIKITPPGGGTTSIHLGNAVCVLGALLLGGFAGGLGGAIGMTIGDLLDPIYIIYAPKTFILKLCIGLIVGLVAHRLGKINQSTSRSHVLKWSVLAAVAGLAFNIIFDPLLGYLYNLVILGKSAADLTLVWNVASTSINAGLSAVAAVAVYLALRPVLMRSGMLQRLAGPRLAPT